MLIPCLFSTSNCRYCSVASGPTTIETYNLCSIDDMLNSLATLDVRFRTSLKTNHPLHSPRSQEHEYRKNDSPSLTTEKFDATQSLHSTSFDYEHLAMSTPYTSIIRHASSSEAISFACDRGTCNKCLHTTNPRNLSESGPPVTDILHG